VVFLVVLGVERQLGIGFSFFSTGWGLLITILITRMIGSRISHERPLTAVATMWVRELTAPRKKTAARGGAVSAAQIRVQCDRPRPGQGSSRRRGRIGRGRSRREEGDGVRARTSPPQT
jgi:hypothetical protein